MKLEEFFMVLFDNSKQHIVILTSTKYKICHFYRESSLAYTLKIV